MTYIRMTKIPSHTYTKHQYRKESEYRSIVVLYILTKYDKYNIITERDLILHEYYITGRYIYMI